MDRQRQIAFPRDGGFSHIDHRSDEIGLARAIAQRGQRVGGFARLADKQRHGPVRDGRFAIAEFRRDIDLDRHAGDLFEPVFRGQAGVESRAAGDHGDTVDLGEIEPRIGQHDLSVRGEIARQGLANDGGLLCDLFRHKMLVAGLVDAGGIQTDLLDHTVNRGIIGVVDLDRRAGQHGAVAFLKVGHTVRHGRKRNRVAAQIHLVVAIADG